MPRNNNIQFRKGTYSQWDAQNSIVLNSGEPGFITDFNKLKIGDGSTEWSDLPAINDALTTLVYNGTASTIPEMSVVYINGAQGDMPRITPAIATSDSTSSKSFGITTRAIAAGSTGMVVVDGILRNINTQTQFNGSTVGSVLYLSPTTSGALTTIKPYAPNHLVSVGNLIRIHGTQGVINVRIQNGFELDELHNVAVTGATNGQFLQYNVGSGLWMPTSSGNFTSLNLNNSGVSVIGHTHTSSDITNFNSSVSGLLPTISNSGDNRVLTSTGSTVGINAESNLTFDGSLLSITGSGNFSNGLSVNNNIVWHSGNLSNPISGSLIRTANSIPVFNSTNSITNSKIDDLPFYTVFNNNIIISYGQYDGYDYGLMEYDSNQVIAIKYQPSITPYFIYGGGTPDNGNMTINGDNGNVGIGTSTPSYKLDVNGDMRINSSGIFASGINLPNQTASTVASFDSNKNIISLSTTTYPSLTELSYVKGVTSAIQTQINTKQATLTNPVTGTGTSGYLSKWTSTSGLTNSIIYDNGSKIGISTITPSGELHVIGTGIFSSRLGVATNTPQYTLDVNGNANISGTLTFKDFTENVVAIGNSSTSQTLSLTNGTVQTCTLTGNCVFTMPTTTAGKSFTLFLNTGAGSFTASFTSVRWAGNTAPTITTTASKVDILSFISDGTYWYGSYSQNYG